ncbi:hypothetical protein [Futiania mangrovi]|uniref:Uncharacterized protein n=1 Tax=Futiania mangrovi TaxID=2959716 RepID=A0A9J6PIE5_9PROT|nr:hypothetical protein [Futiania mangrovii]MCP1337571.1 hypothetical protein [Futiania mangrovii]
MATAELRSDIISAMRNDGAVDAQEFADIVRGNFGDDISDAAIDQAFAEMSGSDLSTPLTIRGAAEQAVTYNGETSNAGGSDAGQAVQGALSDAMEDDGQLTFAEFKAIYATHGDGTMSDADLRAAYKSGSSFSADAMAGALADVGVTGATGGGTSANGSGATGGGTSANGSGATGGTSGGGGTADKDADYFYPFAAGGIAMFLPADGVSTFDTFKQGVVDTIVNDGGDAAWVTDAVIQPYFDGIADKSDFDQIVQAGAEASAAAYANGTGATGGTSGGTTGGGTTGGGTTGGDATGGATGGGTTGGTTGGGTSTGSNGFVSAGTDALGQDIDNDIDGIGGIDSLEFRNVVANELIRQGYPGNSVFSEGELVSIIQDQFETIADGKNGPEVRAAAEQAIANVIASNLL